MGIIYINDIFFKLDKKTKKISIAVQNFEYESNITVIFLMNRNYGKVYESSYPMFLKWFKLVYIYFQGSTHTQEEFQSNNFDILIFQYPKGLSTLSFLSYPKFHVLFAGT